MTDFAQRIADLELQVELKELELLSAAERLENLLPTAQAMVQERDRLADIVADLRNLARRWEEGPKTAEYGYAIMEIINEQD